MSHISDSPIQPEEALRGRAILIVEDDKRLAERIARLFESQTGVDPFVVRTIEGALHRLSDKNPRFDLAIIDVMLPMTEADLKTIEVLEETLRQTRDEIAAFAFSSPADETARTRFLDAESKRSQALKQIDYLIDSEGGVSLIKRWLARYPDRNWDLPTLFLSAVSQTADLQARLSESQVDYHWLVKPVPSELILARCVDLLQRRSVQKRVDQERGDKE
jgi:DNA-binding response OmpR family regulator